MVWRSLLKAGRHDGGNVATLFAMAAIPVLLGITGAVELSEMLSQKSRLQAAADAGALAGAARLSVALYDGQTEATTAAVTTAKENLNGTIDGRFTVVIDKTAGTLTVNGEADHKSLIGFMDFNKTLHATATAEALQKTPLCVLQTDTGGITLSSTSSIRAPGCLIHADQNIAVANSAHITAERIQATGTVSGPMSPAGNAGALAIPDPFVNLNLNPSTLCTLSLNILAVQTIKQDLNLAPGVHCLPIIALGTAHIHLLPGDHYFVGLAGLGGLTMNDNSTIDGDDVALIFGPGQNFNFAGQANVRLKARKTGPFAGFLIATMRNNTNTFKISSSNVSELLGTIYIPNATLDVSSTGNVAQDSDWSVIVAKKLTLSNGPSLVINTNYVGSGVPVPKGVGPDNSTVLRQ